MPSGFLRPLIKEYLARGIINVLCHTRKIGEVRILYFIFAGRVVARGGNIENCLWPERR